MYEYQDGFESDVKFHSSRLLPYKIIKTIGKDYDIMSTLNSHTY